MTTLAYLAFLPSNGDAYVNPESLDFDNGSVDFFPGAGAVSGRNLFQVDDTRLGMDFPPKLFHQGAVGDFRSASFDRGVDSIESALLQMCAPGTEFTWIDLLIRADMATSSTKKNTLFGYRFGSAAVSEISGGHPQPYATETLTIEYGQLSIGYRVKTGTDTYGPATIRGWDRVNDVAI